MHTVTSNSRFCSFRPNLNSLRSFASSPTHTNRLQFSKSPYLQQHKHNPVDWYPWENEAFQQAKDRNVPIFLSVGYSTCHWCHVMEKESFEDPETAVVLNRDFVPVKVDREERPDVDRVYMKFVQATSGGHGGWPMSVWLTPDLKPFFGGTYFPKTERYGQPAFVDILEKIAEVWKTQNDHCLASAEDVTQKLKEVFQDHQPEGPSGSIQSSFAAAVLSKFFNSMTKSFDPVDGGFSSAPKFPRPVIFTALFHCFLNDHFNAKEMIDFTLKKIANGGIHDHIGGGFHRYSVDPTWLVPHFEKMLYDQAQLTNSYLSAYQLSKEKLFADTAHDILQYVQRELLSPQGGFYSAEDADSFDPNRNESVEGAYYVWEKEELDRLLDPEVNEIFCELFGVQTGGNVNPRYDPHNELEGKNILIRRFKISQIAEKFSKSEEEINKIIQNAIHTIRTARNQRRPPFLDDKIITSWNGLMISAFARGIHEPLAFTSFHYFHTKANGLGSQILQTPAYLEVARNAVVFLQTHLFQNGKLIRNFKDEASQTEGFTDDYAFLIYGLIDLYEASSEYRWLKWAIELQSIQDTLFFDNEVGGYFSSVADQKDLIFRLKDEYDGAEPSPNSISVSNLVKLYQITSNPQYREKAERTLSCYKKSLNEMPGIFPHLLAALDMFAKSSPPQIILAGNPTELQEMKYAIYSVYSPHRSLLYCDGQEGQKYLKSLGLSFISDGDMRVNSKATAYICKHFTCGLPTNDSKELIELLTE